MTALELYQKLAALDGSTPVHISGHGNVVKIIEAEYTEKPKRGKAIKKKLLILSSV